VLESQSHVPKVFLKPGKVVAVFVLQPSSRSYLGGCNPGDDDHVDMGGGVSQPGLAQGFIQAKLGFKLASSALENGFVGPRFAVAILRQASGKNGGRCPDPSSRTRSGDYFQRAKGGRFGSAIQIRGKRGDDLALARWF
jgi:hypothetical protein